MHAHDDCTPTDPVRIQDSPPPPRRFNRGQRAAAYLAAGGICAHCPAQLETGFHVDHRLAWINGGTTTADNADATCPRCNLAKAAAYGPPNLRRWQSDALRRWSVHPAPNFLAVGTPGSGKTTFAAHVAGRGLAAGVFDLVIVAVPTEHLKLQWATAMSATGIDIEPDWRGADGPLPPEGHGIAVTYDQLGIGTSADVLAHHLGKRRALTILDEVHHCGTNLAWGRGTRTAFGGARKRLLLSGTPFRSDSERIPFVDYVDGRSRSDFLYEYDAALADGVVRPVWFPTRGGRVEWADGSGETRSASFEEPLDQPADVAVRSRRLRAALDPSGQWMSAVLQDASASLDAIRATDTDAAGLVVATDTGHAAAIAKLLERLGHQPVVVSHEDPASSDKITAFAESTASWIVAVRMISEGVDVPRLRVGVYATTVSTELFFRQVVGRLVRVKDPDVGEHAEMFIPHDERLIGFARTIADMRDHVLDDEAAGKDLEVGPAGGLTNIQHRQQSLFVPISSAAEDTGVVFDGDHLNPDQLARGKRIVDTLPSHLTRNVSPDFVALVAIAVDHDAACSRPAGAAPGALDLAVAPLEPTAGSAAPLYRRRKELRAANSRASRGAAFAAAMDFAATNRLLNRMVGVDKVSQATIAQLELRLRLAQRLRNEPHMFRPDTDPPSFADRHGRDTSSRVVQAELSLAAGEDSRW